MKTLTLFVDKVVKNKNPKFFLWGLAMAIGRGTDCF